MSQSSRSRVSKIITPSDFILNRKNHKFKKMGHLRPEDHFNLLVNVPDLPGGHENWKMKTFSSHHYSIIELHYDEFITKDHTNKVLQMVANSFSVNPTEIKLEFTLDLESVVLFFCGLLFVSLFFFK
jgi:hypothetical protein